MKVVHIDRAGDEYCPAVVAAAAARVVVGTGKLRIERYPVESAFDTNKVVRCFVV